MKEERAPEHTLYFVYLWRIRHGEGGISEKRAVAVGSLPSTKD